MLNAIEAEAAFLVAINTDMSVVELGEAVTAITVEFNAFLAYTYGMKLSEQAGKEAWEQALAGNGEAGYDVMEADYATYAAGTQWRKNAFPVPAYLS